VESLEAFIASQIQWRFVRLVGRGTTALYVALRALSLRDGPGEVILPDVICSNVLDAVLLAGYTPIFANVERDRFMLDMTNVRQQITASTRAVVTAHLFGYTAEIPTYGVPVIEDAVQGLGGSVNGQPVGTLGDVSFTSFNETKMVGGQGGVVATDDESLWDAIQHIELASTDSPSPFAARGVGGEVNRFNSYNHQLATIRNSLIRTFDASPENISRIQASWGTLAANVSERNEKARYLRDKLADLPLALPEIRPGDAIWRYSFIAPNRTAANWILRHLQLANLSGSNLYPSLSNIFTQPSALASQSFAPNIVNLWVDTATDQAQLDQAITIIRSTPWKRLGVT